MPHTLAIWLVLLAYLLAMLALPHMYGKHENENTPQNAVKTTVISIIIDIVMLYGANWWEFDTHIPSGIQIHLPSNIWHIAALTVSLVISAVGTAKTWFKLGKDPKIYTKRNIITLLIEVLLQTTATVYGAGWVTS